MSLIRFARTTLPAIMTISGLTATGVFPSIPAAQAAPAPGQAVAAAPIQGLYDALAKATKASGDIAQRQALIAPAVDASYDLEEILHRSIGLQYNNLQANERSTLLKAFRKFTIARYVSTFKPGSDALFAVVPVPNTDATGRTVIHSTIGSKEDASNPTSIDYVMTQTPGGWRIIDVLLDGHISQVAAQRSDFKAVFAQGGAAGLTRMFDQKADDFLRE
ncbi:ABC transporter substrate-binding protein [Acetobacteraceae bacterium ESL0709]|nr:ABC transporter substrate-binding protein [Acetobacteraceae bacterium ESL0697]MDF7677359.1 ABC transporter substrate-binding protein [Acetobacteraceae bacterium ESL0709]